MKVLKAWRRTMLSILASMAFLPVAISSTWAVAQEGAMEHPAIERGADGLGYYAPGYEPGAVGAGGYGDPYGYGCDGNVSAGEAFMDDMDAECRHFGGHFRNALCLLAPYTAGGRCAPRWFDISVEGLYLDRDIGDNVTFMADGLNAVGGPALGTQNLNFDYEGVPKITFAGQVGPAGLVEFTYMGLGNWNSAASVNSNGDLFSPFSQFGVTPAFGFDESDQASFASLAYSSTFDSYELNLRRRWQGPTCLFQGSYLLGVRHFRLEEAVDHSIVGRSGTLDYDIRTANALTGLQIGGDLYLCAIPGILAGAEVKAGIYGNAADQASTLTSTTGSGTVFSNEVVGADSAAFLGEASVTVLYRLSQNITLKGGYSCLYVTSVALASENANFAPASLAGIVGNRTPLINDTGDVFYHGAIGGVEFSW
jgi:hypothetical protein